MIRKRPFVILLLIAGIALGGLAGVLHERDVQHPPCDNHVAASHPPGDHDPGHRHHHDHGQCGLCHSLTSARIDQLTVGESVFATTESPTRRAIPTVAIPRRVAVHTPLAARAPPRA